MDRKDDGSFIGGFVMAIACLVCFISGYFLRDAGYQFQIQQPSSPSVERNYPMGSP